MLQHFRASQRAAGFTLIETMIVVIIVAVLAGIALPSYQNSMLKGRRSDAMSALLEASNQLEQFMLDRSTYTANLSLIFPATRITDTTKLLSDEGFYEIEATSCGVAAEIANCYTLTAEPTSDSPQNEDKRCAKLILGSDGVRTAKNAADDPNAECW